MARRIVLAVLALIAAVLGVVAVPLGLITAGQDMRYYRDEAVASATMLANAAEERLDDGKPSTALDPTIAQLAMNGDRVSVFDSAGRRVAGTTEAPPVTAAQLQSHGRTRPPWVYPHDDWILVVMPVRRDTPLGLAGTVVLARPSSAIDRQVTLLWVLIAAVATAGLLAATLVAIGLARWVSKPLSQLEHAAQDLGDGALSTRSPVGSGPSEVRRLAANFNQMAARLEALVHGHQATMADVSHQLRTPLAALRLRLDLIAQDADEQMAAELAGAQEEIARLSRLVNGLLAVARAENATAMPVRISLAAVIGNRVAAWRPAAEERGVTLTTDIEPADARMGDGQLEQILDNLIANALDALTTGGAISITSALEADRAIIRVADNGPGMSQQQQRLAFRRFATSESGGIGLGLAIVDRLVVSNGGAAALSDTPGGGLTVTIDLPAVPRERALRRGASIAGAASHADLAGQPRRPRRAARAAENHPPD